MQCGTCSLVWVFWRLPCVHSRLIWCMQAILDCLASMLSARRCASVNSHEHQVTITTSSEEQSIMFLVLPSHQGDLGFIRSVLSQGLAERGRTYLWAGGLEQLAA